MIFSSYSWSCVPLETLYLTVDLLHRWVPALLCRTCVPPRQHRRPVAALQSRGEVSSSQLSLISKLSQFFQEIFWQARTAGISWTVSGKSFLLSKFPPWRHSWQVLDCDRVNGRIWRHLAHFGPWQNCCHLLPHRYIYHHICLCMNIFFKNKT